VYKLIFDVLLLK